MGKITKSMQQKHRETLSPWLKNYVNTASTTPLPLLPQQLASFPSRWPFGRGDLYHWIPLLNRFDSILEHVCTTYKLNEGPQAREFGCDVLLNQNKDAGFGDEKQWSKDELLDLKYPADGDRQLTESVLRFSRMLLEHCGNRSIYASSAHLNDLLHTTSLSILIATLAVGSELAQRYQASVKRIGTASRQISTALLANHYNIDLDRVQQLALPFVKTPIISLSDPVTPGSSSKGKERPQASSRNVTSMHANDLVALADSDDKRWSGWGDVKVSYYPQNRSIDHDASADRGRASLPGTPTPLRRSSTMTAQHQTPRPRNNVDDSSPIGPRTPGFTDDSLALGQKSFDVPQSSVNSKPLHELISRCPSDLPPASKYEAFHRLRVAKALMHSRESRRQLLAVRLLAITNLAYIHSETNFMEKVLRQDADETRQFQLVYQLAELIHPGADGKIDVPLWIQAIALALLEAISNFPVRCPDVLSALNASVNHGILLYVIRKAVAGMTADNESEKSDQVTETDDWRNNLFSLTLHLSMATRVGSEMVSAGLMEILVEILNIRSNVAQRNHSMVLAFLDGLIWTYHNAFAAFFNANGLDAVAKLHVDTVKEAQTLQKSAGTTQEQQSSVVDYEIPYYQQQTLKWLLKFVHHIMSNSYSYSGNTDRLLRNLADKTDLLTSLRDIIGDKKSFGSVVWTATVTILSDFINNDPTSFAAISESGMIRTFLEAITGRPLPKEAIEDKKTTDQGDGNPDSPESIVSLGFDQDSSPHPPPEESLRQLPRDSLASGILPSSEAINGVPQVLNSLCLNNAGMRMVVASKAFDSFLEIFESPAHVKCLEVDGELGSNIGASFDELARHHPPLRMSISNAVIDLVARIRFLGIEKARTAGWGTRLLLVDSNGKTVSVDEQANIDAVPETRQKDKEPKKSGEEDVDMTDAAASLELPSDGNDENQTETEARSFTPYILALSSFLSSYVANTTLRSTFVEHGGIELLLDICESPSLTSGFSDTLASRILNQVVSQLIDHAPIRGLPSLLRRAQSAIDTLRPLVTRTDSVPPYFGPFLAADLNMTYEGFEASDVARNGTKIVKALLNSQFYLKIVSDCFHTMRSNVQFYPVNVFDYYLRLVKSIGPLLRGILLEEEGVKRVIPQSWIRPGPQTEASSEDNPVDLDRLVGPVPDLVAYLGREKAKAEASSRQQQSTEDDRSSPRFQNWETLQTLLHPLIPTSFPFLQTLGKALLPRRDRDIRDPYQRPRHLEIATALANCVLDHLRPSLANSKPTSTDLHYWIIMLHAISEMLIDHVTSRPADRGGLQLIMPVLLAFKNEGGLDVLNSMLKTCSNIVRQGSDANQEDPKAFKLAAFGLKNVLDLYFTLVNGKHYSESSSHFSLLTRGMDRSQSTPPVHQQIVIEFRAAILPEITELWESSIVEQVPIHTVTRLIDILKVISVGDHEPQTLARDRPPFHIFKYDDVRFDWRAHRESVKELINSGFDAELVHEAVFRANGNTTNARDYCRAYNAGSTGPRNPIPLEDADTSALDKDKPSGSDQELPNDASAAEPDRMSLDGISAVSPDLADRFLRDVMGEPVARSPQATDETRETPSAPTEPQHTTAGHASSNNDGDESGNPTESEPVPTIEDIDAYRVKLRKSLIDRCLDVIRAHPDSAIEVADLIHHAVLHQRSNEAQEEVGTTLTFAISSLALEEEEKKRNGKCIAAYAHLLALLLQEQSFLKSNIEILREKAEEYVALLRLLPAASGEEIPPWIPYILLVVEVLLCYDERPAEVEWKAPKSLDEAVTEPVIELPTPLINEEKRLSILESLMELLPRIGKEETLATSALRVLVILTRNRVLAKQVGDKKNLQRLFLMAKQLSGSGSERLKQTRLTANIMIILRHIVEDEEIIKQIMRAEIAASMTNPRNQRGGPIDVQVYLRNLSSIALRAPDLFVEATNEMVRFTRWSNSAGSNDGARLPLILKENQTEKTTKDEKVNGDDTPSVPESSSNIKQSTEPVDRDMSDVPKGHHESKRPVVENPDGVVHFLLSELVNYREVDDKEAPILGKDTKTEGDLSNSDAKASSSKESTPADEKDKKPSKPVFKAEEHPIFIYRCFLLNCLAELLQSYNRTKVEFINFKRSAPPLTTNTPIKPRSSVLNYLIYDLLCQDNLSGTMDSISAKKKAATSSQAQKVLVALVSKTSEKAIDRSKGKFEYDDESDLLFVRKFVLDTMLKAYERAPISDEPLEVRYSRMQCLAELMNCMLGDRDKEQGVSSRSTDQNQTRSQAQLRRLMYEKGYLDKLTSSIAEINLSYPGVKRAIKYILRVLRVLTDTAKELSQLSLLPAESLSDNTDDDFDSTSSLSDLEDDREETPDLYRNSSLGMLEPRGEDDESDEDEDDDDEDMYGDEYDDDEMDYGDDDISDGEDNISSDDEELSGMGEIEGLHGEPGVVEVIMDDGDEDEEDTTSDDDDDDEADSADMEDVEDRVEIVDEEGNPIDDDGNSGWESESHDEDDEDPDEDDLDYEADVHEDDEAHIHGMGAGHLLDGMARAIMGDPDLHPELMEGLDDHYLDDGHDDEEDDEEEEDLEDEEYIYDDDYPLDDQPPPMPALGWDGLNPELEDRQRQLLALERQHRARLVSGRPDSHSPFPQGFMVGHREAMGDFRSYFRGHRPAPQSGADDGINPLLRRNNQNRESAQRQAQAHTIGLRLPEGIFGSHGRHAIDGPMSFLGELMEFLPLVGRSGQHAFHLQITGPGGIPRELSTLRGPRTEQRRDGSMQEPYQAVSFATVSTLDRYQEEARMVFVSTEANHLSTLITAKLAPAAIDLEKKVKAEEAENQRKLEEKRKKFEEEQRLAREAKEAQEKAEKEKKEAEEREAAVARAASEAAANNQAAESSTEGPNASEESAMEGVESTDSGRPEHDDVPGGTTGGSDEARVMTTIRGEEVDVTELGIDPDYLAALPEEFREEVIAQTVSTRRSQAREDAPTGESTEVFQEFLDALPEELRLEIAQQERQEERRRRGQGDHNRQPPQSGPDRVAAPEMDTASILLTFPPELREQVLMDQGEDIMDQLPPEMAAQARALNPRSRAEAVITGRTPPAATRPPPSGPVDEQAENKRRVVQMLDKAGVATLLRLMFINQQPSIRNVLFGVFEDVCENRQNRLEVVSTLLQILQEGSIDMSAVERSFGQLSLKARRPKDKDRETEQKTPQNLKRSLSTLHATRTAQPNSETSPLLIVQQCLDLLVQLCKNSNNVYLFLTEHEIVGSTLKRALGRKGKAKDKDSKATKYAINSLLTLLDRDLVMESSVVMNLLAELLNRITAPVSTSMPRRRKEAEEELKTLESTPAEPEVTGAPTASPAAAEGSSSEPAESTPAQPQDTTNSAVAGPVDEPKEREGRKEAARKKLRQNQPPVIPPQNLNLAVRIFVARECSSKTFQNTIATIKNLSAIPGAKSVFGQELVRQARLLSENIVSDLDELLPHIEKASSGTEIQGVALAKFSPGASEQNKLLRVLTALDHLFDQKKKAEDSETDKSKDERQDLVVSLYHNSTFSAMWEKLSACLSAIRQRENMLNVATILLPLIESLMVVCKNTTTNDDPSQNQGAKDMVLSSPPPESRTASLFFNFTEDHRRILNELVRNNPKLMSGTFALLVKNPKVLEFDNKRNYFSRSVHSRGNQQHRPSWPSLQLSVRREHVFHDSFKSLYFKSGDEMKFGKLNIRFHGEEGVDAGGVTREWFQVLARQMFDPNYVLFIPVSSDRTTFHPNKLSGINDEHLMFFKFIGRIIGKALYEGRVLDCYFSRAVYKRILGKSVSVKDMESFDPDYYKSLCWMLENDITDIITETFSVEDDEFGVTNVVDLIPNGREIAVTEENKSEYVRLVVEHKLLSSVREQMESFLKGFHEIIPAELISIFNEQELELLISGLPDIDVDDWKSNTEYHNYNPSSQQIQWFWRALRSFDKEERAKLLQFVTGTSKVPLNGFKELEGMNGVNRFNIHRDYGNKDRLPTSHTCFNQLDLPEYDSYDSLRSQIMKAITAGSEYFGFA